MGQDRGRARRDGSDTDHGDATEGGRGRGKHHGHGGRSRRLFDYGELRLLILAMIAQRPRHGYEIIREIKDRFDGRYCPSPGVIYPTLAWLEDMGYVTIVADGSGRKQSQIRPEGAAFLVANRAAADELLIRRLPAARPDHVPRPIEEAMEALKAALRTRLEPDLADADEIAAIAAAIAAAARAIARDR